MIIINKIKDIRYITLSYVSTKYILSSEQMEYTIGYYRRQIEKVLTTTDGHKYLQCKV